jgi:hypothetical protein
MLEPTPAKQLSVGYFMFFPAQLNVASSIGFLQILQLTDFQKVFTVFFVCLQNKILYNKKIPNIMQIFLC